MTTPFRDYEDFEDNEELQEPINAQSTYIQEEEDMLNAVQGGLKKVVNGLNIQDYDFKEITTLRETFSMTKYIANMTLPEDKVHLITKVLLANLISSARVYKQYARVLTSTKRIAAHLGISTSQVQYQLTILQNMCVNKIPIFVCRPYNINRLKGNQATCQRIEPITSHDKMLTYEEYSRLTGMSRRYEVRSMGFNAWERPVEIIIPTYSYFRYNKNRKKDFFFEVHASWGAPELSLVERIFMYLIQKHAYINRIQGGDASTEGSLGMYANIFKVGIPYIHKVLNALNDKGYINLEIHDFTAYIQLQPKGHRKIAYYEEQIALARRGS